MTTLLLIRHGQNDYVGRRLAGRRPDVHLNDHGRAQAQELAENLCHAPIKAIYSSPLERAIETAQPLAQALNLPIQIRPGMVEIDFGKWVGKTPKQMARTKLWKVVQNSPSQMRFPEGESFPEAQQRLAQELEAIALENQPDNLVAVFSHSDAIKLAVAHFLGLPLDNFQRLAVDTASISTVVVPQEGAPMLVSLNQKVKLTWPEKPPEKKKKKQIPS
jgi:probable phosphoglycerate mutase